MADLRLRVADVDLAANWTDETLETRAAIEAALPLEGEATRWGDELYFEVETAMGDEIEADAGAETAQTEVPEGSIAYWPTGNALCLFWGPTPASVAEEPRAAAPVTVVATVEDVAPLAGIDGGASMRLEAAGDV